MTVLGIAVIGLFVSLCLSIICRCITDCKELEVTHNTIEDKEEVNDDNEAYF